MKSLASSNILSAFGAETSDVAVSRHYYTSCDKLVLNGRMRDSMKDAECLMCIDHFCAFSCFDNANLYIYPSSPAYSQHLIYRFVQWF